MPSLQPLAPDLFLIPDLLPSHLCRHLIDIAECCQLETANIELGTLATQIRDNDYLSLDSENPLLASTNDLLIENLHPIQHLLHDHYGFAFPHLEACTILRYQVGQSYKRHVDNMLLGSRLEEAARGVPTRDISVVGYLNDDFTGGETWFDRQDVKVKPQAGAVIVFPASYTHPHQALPVHSGQKYAFTTWLFH